MAKLGGRVTTAQDLAQKLRDMFETSGYRLNDRIPPERE